MSATLAIWAVASSAAWGAGPAESLPVGSAPPALGAPHFPSRLHTFVWRNWECCNLDRMAGVVGSTPDEVAAIGQSMGLPPHQPVSEDQLARSYISIIRRNWHLLNYDQLLKLLGWSAERLAYTLREDDFLYAKLGQLKPACPPLTYAAPDEAALKRCAEIKAVVWQQCGMDLSIPGEPRFAFLKELSQPLPALPPASRPADDEPIRFLYSYFAVYGDPLTDERLNPYPDGLLQRLRQVGVNGVWLHVVLRQLAPSSQFPEFGEGSETRLANLAKLVERAKRHGIRIYLYMNEPRAMPPQFFEHREEMRGVAEGDFHAMCTSSPEVREWITGALRHVFGRVPDLGGVFTITGSENLTNCWSHYQGAHCPRCAKRPPAEVLCEINAAIARGVREGSPRARTICWDWGWQNTWCDDIIAHLPKDVYLMSVSEWDLPITRGGISTTVGEYSISSVGPGPRAKHNWEAARKAGLKTMAKVQVNCTWEISAMPYLPVLSLVGEHMANLNAAGVEGLMLSWTLGGYPSPNLDLVNRMMRQPAPDLQVTLLQMAVQRYGPQVAPATAAMWKQFGDAFREYPYHGSTLYDGPMQVGPANLLYPEPTNYHATMVGFPYDDVDRWRSVYPAQVLADQFGKIGLAWERQSSALQSIVQQTNRLQARLNAEQDWRLARAAALHFRSAANQVRFILARNALRGTGGAADRDRELLILKMAARNELETAREMFSLARADSKIGYEASNHYYYFPFDLVEKVVNCDYVLNRWLVAQGGSAAALPGSAPARPATRPARR